VIYEISNSELIILVIVKDKPWNYKSYFYYLSKINRYKYQILTILKCELKYKILALTDNPYCNTKKLTGREAYRM
jgi:hypothetical protein